MKILNPMLKFDTRLYLLSLMRQYKINRVALSPESGRVVETKEGVDPDSIDGGILDLIERAMREADLDEVSVFSSPPGVLTVESLRKRLDLFPDDAEIRVRVLGPEGTLIDVPARNVESFVAGPLVYVEIKP